MKHPAVAAMEDAVGKVKEQREGAERSLARAEESIVPLRQKKAELIVEEKKTRKLLSSAVRQFEPRLVSEEDEPSAEPARAEAPSTGVQPPNAQAASAERRRIGEETYKEFRAWVYQNKSRIFSVSIAAKEFGRSNKTLHTLIEKACERGLLESVGKWEPQGFRGGQRPLGYRFKEASTRGLELLGTPPSPEPQGSQPVAGTGNGRNGIDKDYRSIIANALGRGATYERTGGDHFRLSMPGKQPIIFSATPSDARAQKKLKSEMQRHSYPL